MPHQGILLRWNRWNLLMTACFGVFLAYHSVGESCRSNITSALGGRLSLSERPQAGMNGVTGLFGF